MNHSSLRQSPGGSTALWCHCSSRCVFVKVPSFSVCAAAGRKKTSVSMSCVRMLAVAISGTSCQNVGRLDQREVAHHQPVELSQPCALQLRPFVEPTTGFSPMTK